MKLTGITGTGTGKLGSSVFATVAGQQIVRQYQPVVANPSTDAQVAQRAKLKLGSQLARDLKPAIAIPKDGLVTSRNRFISKNFALLSFANETASVQLEDIQLTDGSTYMVGIESATAPEAQGGYVVEFEDGTVKNFDLIALHAFIRNDDGSLSHIAGQDIPVARISEQNTVVLTVDGVVDAPTNAVVFAYGINFTTEGARVTYQDLSVNEGRTIASLLASRSQVASEMIPSKTVAKVVTAGE